MNARGSDPVRLPEVWRLAPHWRNGDPTARSAFRDVARLAWTSPVKRIPRLLGGCRMKERAGCGKAGSIRTRGDPQADRIGPARYRLPHWQIRVRKPGIRMVRTRSAATIFDIRRWGQASHQRMLRGSSLCRSVAYQYRQWEACKRAGQCDQLASPASADRSLLPAAGPLFHPDDPTRRSCWKSG